MKIGIDARLWAQTGVGRYIRNLIENLQKVDNKNNYVLFVRPQDYESIRPQILNPKWEIVKTDIRWHSLEEQFKFPSVLYERDLDLVHFPYFSIPVFYNKPFVVTVHDLIVHHFATGKASTLFYPLYFAKRAGYKFVISRAAQSAKKIISVSNATKDEIIDHLKVSEDKIQVIYEGADDKLKASNIKFKTSDTKYKIPHTEYFLYVGNAYPHKNLERLIESFSLLKKLKAKNKKLKLVLVGKDDFFYKRLEEKVRRKNIHSVEFLHDVTDEKLSSLYSNAVALILPSFMEGFGLPVIEAMVNACPVLASDIPSLREIGKDAAIYFDPFSADDMAEKMRDVLSNDPAHWNKNREKGLEIAKQFSWEKMARETLKVYESSTSL